jgi:hypothetical protein
MNDRKRQAGYETTHFSFLGNCEGSFSGFVGFLEG